MTNRGVGILAKCGLDPNDIARSYPNYLRELERAVGPARDELRQAWEDHTEVQRATYQQRMSTLLPPGSAEHQPARKKAETLDALCTMGEETQVFPLTSAKELVSLVICCLQSVSVTLRLLALRVMRRFSTVQAFWKEYFARKEGEGLVGLCVDRASPAEVDPALDIVERYLKYLSDANGKGMDVPAFPIGWAYRLVSFIDVADQCPTISPARRSFCVRLLVKVLETSPVVAAVTDVLRQMLVFVTSKYCTSDDTERILKATLESLDDPRRRGYVKDQDLASVFVPILDTSVRIDGEVIQSMRASATFVCRLMSRWPGLLWIASEGTCIRALIDAGTISGSPDRLIIVATFLNEVLRRFAPNRGIEALPPSKGDGRNRPPSEVGADFDVVDKDADAVTGADSFADTVMSDDDGSDEPVLTTTKSVGYFVGDAMLSALLSILDHHGVPQSLIDVVRLSPSSMRIHAASSGFVQEVCMLFMQITFIMASNLPKHICLGLNARMSLAVWVSKSSKAVVGGLVAKLLNRLYQQDTTNSSALTSIARDVSTDDLDDASFFMLLKESLVEGQPEPTKWNFDALTGLLQALRNPQRLRWIRDNTRFFTRVISFYRPPSVPSRWFGSMLMEEEMVRPLCGFGVALFDVLLSNREGGDILERSEYVKHLRSAFQDVLDRKQTIFTVERLQSTATKELFRFLGRFSSTAVGLAALQSHGVFDAILSLFDNVQRNQADDLTKAVCLRLLQHMCLSSVPNFGVCEPVRSCVNRAMESSLVQVRLSAALQVSRVLTQDLSSMSWGIDRLLDALHGSSLTIIAIAIRSLTSVCLSSDEAVAMLIQRSPDQLVTNPVIAEGRIRFSTSLLLYRILSRPEGFDFLEKHGWVTNELALWDSRDGSRFVEDFEHVTRGDAVASQSSDSFNPGKRPKRARGGSVASASSVLPTTTTTTALTFPPHFLGALCRTEQGCAMLTRSELWKTIQNTLLCQTAVDDTAGATIASPFSPNPSKFEAVLSHTFDRAVSIIDDDIEEAAMDVDMTVAVMRSGVETHHDCAGHIQPGLLTTSKKSSEQRCTETRLDILCNVMQMKIAIFNASFIGSSDVGFKILAEDQRIMQSLSKIARYCSWLSVRGAALVGLSVIARARSAEPILVQLGFFAGRDGGYIGVNGAAFTASFATPTTPDWMNAPVASRKQSIVMYTQAARDAAAPSTKVPKDIIDQAASLINPVSRDGAKARLYSILRDNPDVFLDVSVRQYLLDITNLYRMKHSERQFIAEILHRSLMPSKVAA